MKRFTAAFAAAMAIIDNCGSIFSADGLDVWTKIHESFLFREITYGNGLFVGCSESENFGERQFSYYSADGRTWHRTWQPEILRPIGIAFGNGVFVHAGDGRESGVLLTSTNGRDWKVSYVSETEGYESYRFVTFVKDRFIVAGFRTSVASKAVHLSSTNGLAWTSFEPDIPLGQGTISGQVVYGNGRYVSGGRGGEILSSDDGIHWEVRLDGAANAFFPFSAVSFGNEMFLAANQDGLFKSTDGLEWRPQPTAEFSGRFGFTLTYARDRFIAFAATEEGRQTFTSTDGSHWVKLAESGTVLHSATTDGTNIVFAGNAVLASDDGTNMVTWVQPKADVIAVHELPNATVISANSYGHLTTLISADGNSWARHDFPVAEPVMSVELEENTLFATLRNNGVYTSADGSSWKRTADWPVRQRAVVEQNGVYVGLGPASAMDVSGIFVSTNNRATWTKAVDTPRPFPTLLSSGNGRFLAVGGGNDAPIYSSLDGVTWKSTPHLGQFNSLTFGKGIFAGIIDSFLVRTSSDGTNWVTRLMGRIVNPESEAIRFIKYGAGVFVAIANPSYKHQTTLYASTNGLSWKPRRGVNGLSAEKAFYARNRFYMYGSQVVHQSGPVSPPSWFEPTEIIDDKNVRLRFTLGERNGLFTSTDLRSWTLLTNLSGTTSNYVTPNVGIMRYFRFRSE